MPQFGMTTPMAEEIYHSDPGWLCEVMLHAGSDFWNGGSGEAMVEFGQVWMTLIFDAQHGFYVAYRNPSEEVSYVPLMNNSVQPVRVFTGGQPFYLPESMFVSRELACEIVEEFCQTGERSERLTWRRGDELRWDSQTGRVLDPL